MWRVVVAVCLAVGVAGCTGPSGPPKAKLYPVSGKVTVNNKPLTDCSIIFSTANPASGAAAGYSGKLDADGNFTLSDSADGSAGAAVGKYKVTFVLSPEGAKKAMMVDGMAAGGADPGYEAAAAAFPKEFGSVETSPKEVEVEAKSNVIDIKI
jgi:hypothetical protein